MLLLRDVKKSFVEPGGETLPILDVKEFRLAAGEQVVVDSLQRIIPDSTVKPVPVEVERSGVQAPGPKTEAPR